MSGERGEPRVKTETTIGGTDCYYIQLNNKVREYQTLPLGVERRNGEGERQVNRVSSVTQSFVL